MSLPFHQCPMMVIVGLLFIAGWCPPHHFWNSSCSQGLISSLTLLIIFRRQFTLCSLFWFRLRFAEYLSIHFIVWMCTVLSQPHVCLEHQNLRWPYLFRITIDILWDFSWIWYSFFTSEKALLLSNLGSPCKCLGVSQWKEDGLPWPFYWGYQRAASTWWKNWDVG